MERALNDEWLDAGQFTYVVHDDSKSNPDYYSYVQGHDWQAALQTGENGLLLGSDQERRLCVPDKHIAYQTISNPNRLRLYWLNALLWGLEVIAICKKLFGIYIFTV